jgi:hypothetical protein
MAEVLRTYTATKPCRLTDDERRTYGINLAHILETIDDEIAKHESVKREMKASLADLEAQRMMLATKVRRGEELREVEIEVCASDDGRVQEIRKDTGEIIVTRAPSDEERQLRLRLPATDESALR